MLNNIKSSGFNVYMSFLSEGTDTTDNPSYLDGINNSIRGCGIVCKSDFLKKSYTPKSKEKCKTIVLLSSQIFYFA